MSFDWDEKKAHSNLNCLLLVSYTERSDTIRIISARLATRNERKAYEQA